MQPVAVATCMHNGKAHVKMLCILDASRMKKENLIDLGSCTKPHGIKGAFTFNLFNTEESSLKKKSKIKLFPREGSSLNKVGEDFVISSISFGNKVIAYLEGVNDRNHVEDIIPFDIKINSKNLPKLEEGEFYYKDLLGLQVIDDESNEEVGEVKSFYDNSQQTILVIKGKLDFEILFIDEFVKEICFKDRYISVVVPEVI